MKYNKQVFIFITCFLWVISPINAQSNVLSAGDNANSSSGSTTYSVGQSFYSVKMSGAGSVIEGVQQVIEISVITGTEDYQFSNIQLSVYPNPTSEMLTLDIIDPDQNRLKYLLYDMNGRIIQQKDIHNQKTQILLGNLPGSHYILSVVNDKNASKSFKIIKTK